MEMDANGRPFLLVPGWLYEPIEDVTQRKARLFTDLDEYLHYRDRLGWLTAPEAPLPKKSSEAELEKPAEPSVKAEPTSRRVRK